MKQDIQLTTDVYYENITTAYQFFNKAKSDCVEMRLVRSFADYSKGYWLEYPPYLPLSTYDIKVAEFTKLDIEAYKRRTTNQTPNLPSNDDKDLIICRLTEGVEQWKAEYDVCRAILQKLVDLKVLKDG